MAAFGTFFDGALSWLERACLASFVAHGHAVTLFSYQPLALPDGVVGADAAAILPAERLFRIASGDHAGSVTQFANLFRYRLMRATGLTWVDTDMLCLSRDWPDAPFLLGLQDERLVNNAVLRVPAEHPFLDDAIAAAERIGPLPIWGYTGPHLVTALVDQHGLHRWLLPPAAFYPVPHGQAGAMLVPSETPGRVTWPAETLALHLWTEALRQGGFDRTRPCPPASPIGLMLAQLGLAP